MFGSRAVEYDMNFRAYVWVQAVGADAVCIFVSLLVFNCEHVCGNTLMALGTARFLLF